MRRSPIPGCCVGTIISDLGGAHGHTTAKDVNEFALKLSSMGVANVNVCITNRYQTKEREYLDALGFEYTEVGSLRVHSVAATKLHANKVYKNAKAENQKRVQKEREERLARERARLEQLRARATGPWAKYENLARELGVPYSPRQFGIADYIQWRNRLAGASADATRNYFVRHYGVPINFRQDFNSYYRPNLIGLVNKTFRERYHRNLLTRRAQEVKNGNKKLSPWYALGA